MTKTKGFATVFRPQQDQRVSCRKTQSQNVWRKSSSRQFVEPKVSDPNLMAEVEGQSMGRKTSML